MKKSLFPRSSQNSSGSCRGFYFRFLSLLSEWQKRNSSQAQLAAFLLGSTMWWSDGQMAEVLGNTAHENSSPSPHPHPPPPPSKSLSLLAHTWVKTDGLSTDGQAAVPHSHWGCWTCTRSRDPFSLLIPSCKKRSVSVFSTSQWTFSRPARVARCATAHPGCAFAVLCWQRLQSTAAVAELGWQESKGTQCDLSVLCTASGQLKSLAISQILALFYLDIAGSFLLSFLTCPHFFVL